jgi:hypothetical protein
MAEIHKQIIEHLHSCEKVNNETKLLSNNLYFIVKVMEFEKDLKANLGSENIYKLLSV